MKLPHLVLFFLVAPCLGFAQKVNDSLIVDSYNRTLQYFFTRERFVDLPSSPQNIIIETEFAFRYMTKKAGKFKFRYYSVDFQKHLYNVPETNIGRLVFSLRYVVSSPDTLDIYLDEWKIMGFEKGHVLMEDHYKGRNQELPIVQFIYNSTRAVWELVPQAETELKKEL